MSAPAMKRDDCLKVLARHLTGTDIVLPVYSTAFAWIDIRPHPLNYLSHGAMGLASSHALGLALGRPDRRVIVLDGDGSLLMNLGSLVTIAEAAPPNLYHFVCENGTYEANGAHPIPGRDRVDFAGFARAAGYRAVHQFSELKNFEQQIGALLAEPGPVFADLKIVSSGPQERDYARLHGPQVRQAFRDALADSDPVDTHERMKHETRKRAVHRFERLIHSDWSSNDKKKWMTIAERTGQGWKVASPRLVPCASEFLKCWLFNGQKVLAGFDFPIGVPAAFGKRTGFANFREALANFGSGKWKDFFCVADNPEDISLTRPFYPATYPRGRTQNQLLEGLGFKTMDDLRRECERKTPQGRRAASSVFWTLGGNQVGKATIEGWQSVIQPALHRARLWPFDGQLDELSNSADCVICETYPQEAYAHVGVSLKGGSKRNQEDRRNAGCSLILFAEKRGVIFADDTRKAISDGFGPSKAGEDPFDALVGLLSMIEVVDGRRPEGTPSGADGITWEGWILGQYSTP